MTKTRFTQTYRGTDFKTLLLMYAKDRAEIDPVFRADVLRAIEEEKAQHAHRKAQEKAAKAA